MKIHESFITVHDLRSRRPRWRQAALIFGCWTLLGLFSASQIYIRYAFYSDHPPTWRQAFSVAFSDWYAWGLLSPFILWFTQRFPFERGMESARWLAHIFVGMNLSLLKMVIEIQAFELMMQVQRGFSFAQFHSNFLTYGAIVGIIYALDYYRKYRAHEVKTAQLESRLAQAQLHALKMQLHPHFLFNTLHAISALIHKDAEAADQMIARLADLLRLALENAGVQEVPLKKELEFLERYLAIEQTRFRDRLAVRMNIAPETLDAFVPNLILQPLVENAIRHGLAPRAAAGTIVISAWRENGQLLLQVQDNGPGLAIDQQQAFQHGVGLANTKARLQQLYGSSCRFALQNGDSGGLIVTVEIPFRELGPTTAGLHEN
jgi:sensor histidine kinase YesM